VDNFVSGRMENHVDNESDNEDDPTKLLDQWLGELNTLKKGLGVKTAGSSNGAPEQAVSKAIMREKKVADKREYRCSLINLDTSQDEELDAILGELTVLESQFEQEIQEKSEEKISGEDSALSPLSPASDRSSNITDLGIHSATHSRSSSGSDEIKQRKTEASERRTDSPDTDSAFCDNLSVLSSCSTASSSKTGQSIGVPSTLPALSREEQEARIKAEKIKIAIEKIKEASVKKLFIKVFTSDGSAKSLLVDEKMTVGHVTRILAEKNHVSLDPKWALVELVPDLYMERVYEDNENIVENCLLWKVDSKNTLWFIERPEKFDLFTRPEIYLLGTSSSQKDDQMEEHSRTELLEEYFSSSGVGAPEVEGNIWLKADGKKSWKKFYFVLRTSGLYYAPKGKKSSKDLVCLTTFDVNQVYYGIGWKGKYKAPTEYCFGIKHPQIQAKNPKYIKYLCVDNQKELHQWVTGIRVAKNGRSLFDNYRGIVEEITHADIDILTAKRFSVNSSNGLKRPNEEPQQMLTPSSENKSLASALSSGIESDMSNGSRKIIEGVTEEESESTGSERLSSSGQTPVGTLERGLSLRRSFSRSSRSSSSSGCLSDKSAGFELGFESDFPAGGTIKKRPTTAARLPLTNTTWGLVRENEQEMEVDGGLSSSGGGGTLLRKKAMRNSSLSKKGQDNEIVNGQKISDELGPAGPGVSCRDERVMGREVRECHQTHDQTKIPAQDLLSSAFEQSLSCALEEEALPLPPPPRMDSISSLDDIDLLPPPPPDMMGYENHYHVSQVTSPVVGLPPVTPQSKMSAKQQLSSGSTLKKSGGASQKPSRRISFDDHVQMIEAPRSNTEPLPPLETPTRKAEPILKYSPASPIRNPNPKKLSFGLDTAENYSSLPRAFIDNLQKVMNKKWQVAEKCRENMDTSPYEVLGFRDEPVNKVGQPNMYSKNSAIGAWVLETQMYAQTPTYYQHDGHSQHNHHHKHIQQPPRFQVENVVPCGQTVLVPELGDYGQFDIYRNNGTNQPVVLREPEPCYDTTNPSIYVDPSRLRSNKTKRPPPPPRRSENTQLSNSNC